MDQMADIVELNGLCFCELHLREVCHICTLDMRMVNEIGGFQIAESGEVELPQVTLTTRKDMECKDLLDVRWLAMQQALYSKPKQDSVGFYVHEIVLPPVEGSEDVRCASSPMAMQETLRCLFQQAHGMASTQRFDFASMSQILLHDYETFSEASHLYEEELADIHSRGIDIMAMSGQDLTSSLGRLRIKMANRQKAKATLLSTFSFFLDLKTHQTFWRAMELTAESFVLHVERFNEDLDGVSVLTNPSNSALLEWIGHVFWSLQHSQFRLNTLWNIQHEVFNRGTYPFYPYVREALENGLDVYLIIIKLCKAELHNFASVPLLLKQLQEASMYEEQMGFVNRGMMAAIDEFSTRFRVLQVLYFAAQLVASEDEIKAALLAFPFNPEGAEVFAKEDDVLSLITHVHEGESRPPPPESPSFLQKLIIKENGFRRQHAAKMTSVCPISNNFDIFTKEMFNAFKLNFSALHRDQIGPQWKDFEQSLLPSPIMKRIQHRREVEKEKRKQNKISVPEASGEFPKTSRMMAAQERAFTDASLFWEVGDGSLEPYVPSVIRKKIKTRKEGITLGNLKEVGGIEEENQAPLESVEPRSLNQLKNSDFETRDVLWGKRRGCLRWSALLQLLTRIGCKILNLDGSKKKVVDVHTGLSTVLHMPHPGDTCRTDQRKLYCDHIKEHLKLRYQDFVRPGKQTEPLEAGYVCIRLSSLEVSI